MNKTLKKLLISTKKAAFSQKIGNHTSKIKGEGYDFVELREYEDGEDIRKIDWMISAKMQQPYVKVFHNQRELNISIVPILSGSTYFGTVKLKKTLITEICSLLGYITCAQGDSYSSYIANETSILNTKNTKKLLGVDRMTSNIYNYNPINHKVNYQNITNTLYKQIQKKSIIFLIGDFFDSESLNLDLLAKKHEVIALIIRDNFEEKPIAFSNINFVDPDTAELFEGSINKNLLKNYKKKIENNDTLLYKKLKKLGIKYSKIYTHENPIQKLTELFH